jgi:hypothetical protein
VEEEEEDEAVEDVAQQPHRQHLRQRRLNQPRPRLRRQQQQQQLLRRQRQHPQLAEVEAVADEARRQPQERPRIRPAARLKLRTT